MKPPNAGKGRKRGSNKASADVRAAAQVYTDEALGTLVELMRGGSMPPLLAAAQAFLDAKESDAQVTALKALRRAVADVADDVQASPQTRAYASTAILDRGHGKPPLAVTGEGGTGPVSFTLIEKLYPNG